MDVSVLSLICLKGWMKLDYELIDGIWFSTANWQYGWTILVAFIELFSEEAVLPCNRVATVSTWNSKRDLKPSSELRGIYLHHFLSSNNFSFTINIHVGKIIVKRVDFHPRYWSLYSSSDGINWIQISNYQFRTSSLLFKLVSNRS